MVERGGPAEPLAVGAETAGVEGHIAIGAIVAGCVDRRQMIPNANGVTCRAALQLLLNDVIDLRHRGLKLAGRQLPCSGETNREEGEIVGLLKLNRQGIAICRDSLPATPQ